jgi:HAD superfamily hydrolase (TIGR01509 family)
VGPVHGARIALASGLGNAILGGLQTLRALVFDFDGLILDTESSMIDAYAEVHAAHGVPFERSLFIRSVGHPDFSFDPWHAFEKRADRAALEVERRERNRERDRSIPILPGVVPLMDEALAAGLRLGLASNSGHAHVEGHLGRLGLLGRFSIIACREDFASPKPEPDVYRLVLNQLGIKGREAVSFEDSVVGTRAARRAGLWVVAVPNPSTAQMDFPQAHLRLASLAETNLADLEKRAAAGFLPA